MKKKIKRIFGFIFALLILAVSVFVYCPKAKADTIDYGEYNFLINVYGIADSQYDGQDVYNFNVVAEIRNNTFFYIDGDNNGYAYLSDYDISTVGLYLVNGTTDSNVDAFYYYHINISMAIKYETFIASYDNYSYALGYNEGYGRGLNESYDRGFTDGYDSVRPGNQKYNTIYQSGRSAGIAYYQPGEDGYQEIYNAGYADALDQIGESDATFLVMFKSVINYFVEFFTVGLNVELFGVNIGGFCIAIFMISIMMFIVRFIFGR